MEKYKFIDEKYIEEVNSQALQFIHNKTGAKVLVLKNEDENKTFGIGFRTPPTDGTGVAHIVEHCVLSGSRKYKTKEPFMDLIKYSLQTFLNAMTYSDKTIYPVSSRNTKDFYNLMDVYLDAVFYPAIYDKKEIFLQEGWHYEIFNENEDIKINGVVYNEMKGVYSSAENQVSDAITFNLHKNSTYGHDSGGDPKEIPNLTYENFLNFHRKYYHPSNSYIYLYGDLDYEKVLNYIDENYLSNFDKIDPNSQIQINPSFDKPVTLESTYSISEEENGENKSYATYSFVIGDNDSKLDALMRNIIAELLVESESAPLREVILKSNLGEDFYSETSASFPLDLSFILKNTEKDKLEEYVQLIDSTLKTLVKEGIDKELIESTLNKFEFILREGGGNHQGVIYFARSLNSWLYDNNPFDALSFNEIVSELKSKIDTDFFERYIEEKILNNNFKLLLMVNPQVGKSEKEAEEVSKFLKEYKDSLSKDELNALIEENIKLLEFQNSEDEDAKDTIPSLDIKDIKKGVSQIPREEYEVSNEKFLYNEQFTNGIAYLNVVFPMNHIEKDELPLITILSNVLTKMDTKNYNYKDLNNKIFLKSGGIKFNGSTISLNMSKEYTPKFLMSIKVLEDKIENVSALLEEITLNTILDNKKRIKELLLMSKSQIEAAILQVGHSVAVARVKSYYNECGAYEEDLSGLNFYFYLSNLLDNYEELYPKFINSLEEVYKKIFNKNNLILHLIGGRNILDEGKNQLNKYISALPSIEYKDAYYPFKIENKKEGFTSSANVQYVSKGNNLFEFNEKFTGDYVVLANILSTGYLHNSIRAKGGAYGAGIRFSRDGNMATYSYRDPNLLNTVEIYDNIDKHLENLNFSEKDLNNYIIGVMNSFDPVQTPEDKGMSDLMRYISKTSVSDIEKLKEEALNTNLDKLKALAPLIKGAMESDYLTVIGNENIIKENSNLFNNITSLKK